jgi:thioredoxin-dependent peroxiredoxin
MSRLAEGDKAPAFTLKDHDGTKVALKDFAGSRVVLYFYPADDTPGCTKEACQFNDELDAFRSLDVHVIGISPDGAEKHQAFRAKYGLHFTLLSDPDKSVMEKYGAFGEKMMYGKKVQGVIRSTFVVGPKGTIERAYYNVRADGHAGKVLEGLSS